jgi:hypothetical protein
MLCINKFDTNNDYSNIKIFLILCQRYEKSAIFAAICLTNYNSLLRFF